RMIEGEKSFDIVIRWPPKLRSDIDAILDIPVDITGNVVTTSTAATLAANALAGGSAAAATRGTGVPMPALVGSAFNATFWNPAVGPRIALRHLVSPPGSEGQATVAAGDFKRIGASTIYREQRKRLIAVKFGVNNKVRDLASAVAEAQDVTADLFEPPYRAEWSGEFQEMEEAEHRLAIVFGLSMVLIVILLYLAFRSLLDAVVVLSNVFVMGIGGIWALLLTGT